MTFAPTRYPKRLDPMHWCRNGSVPDAFFARQVAWALNHAQAYRRKTIAVWGDLDNRIATGSGTATLWRTYFRSGIGVSELRFKLGLGLATNKAALDPRVEVEVTPVGGAPLTATIHFGANQLAAHVDTPSNLHWTEVGIEIAEQTTYEVAVKSISYGAPVAGCVYEWADPDVASGLGRYVELVPAIEQPIYDQFRQDLLEGLSELWLANGAQLVSWLGTGQATAITQTGTTWKNVLDNSSTTISAATPGYDLGALGTGARGVPTLDLLGRLKDGVSLPVTFAVYGNTDVGSTGEVRLADATGSVCAVTGITTTLGWVASDLTIANADDVAKLDLQVRNGTAGQTTNVYAVALFTRAA